MIEIETNTEESGLAIQNCVGFARVSKRCFASHNLRRDLKIRVVFEEENEIGRGHFSKEVTVFVARHGVNSEIVSHVPLLSETSLSNPNCVHCVNTSTFWGDGRRWVSHLSAPL